MITRALIRGSLYGLAALLTICSLPTGDAVGAFRPRPARVVSLAPSITGTMIHLGLEETLVGITDWCEMPNVVSPPMRVGGHVDPVIEAVLSLQPDLVIVEKANFDTVSDLTKLNLDLLQVEHRNLEGVLESISLIARACHVTARGDSLRLQLQNRMNSLRKPQDDLPRPRVLVVVGRDISTGRLRDIYAAGAGTFLGQLVDYAGGENVAPGKAIGYPIVSREALMRLDPQVILELAPEFDGKPDDQQQLQRAWRDVTGVSAVAADRVHLLCDERMLVPDPGFVDTLEIMVRLLFPRGLENE
jgi:cobalamin transport system substrate-binding protein